jgi:3-hydroxyacyl-CoA dehydrogenase
MREPAEDRFVEHFAQHVAVIGAGTMGHGIAQVCAMAGYEVVLADATAEFAQRGLDRIRENLRRAYGAAS